MLRQVQPTQSQQILDFAGPQERLAAGGGSGAEFDFGQLRRLGGIAGVDFGHIAQPHQAAGALAFAAQVDFSGVANQRAAKPNHGAVGPHKAARRLGLHSNTTMR